VVSQHNNFKLLCCGLNWGKVGHCVPPYHYVNAIPTTETTTPLRNAICITYTEFPIRKPTSHYVNEFSITERCFHYVNAIPTTKTKTPLRNAICITYTQFPIQKRNLHYYGGSEAVYCRDLLHIHCGCLAIDQSFLFLFVA